MVWTGSKKEHVVVSNFQIVTNEKFLINYRENKDNNKINKIKKDKFK